MDAYENYRTHQGLSTADLTLRSRRPYFDSLIRKHFPKDRSARILDIGCGSGLLLHLVASRGYGDVTGIDASLEQRRAAPAEIRERIQVGELLPLLRAAAPASVDVVISFDVLEHLTKSEVEAVAREVFRVLKANGRWIVHVPNAAALFGARVRYADWTHKQAFTSESLGQVFRIGGFGQMSFHEDAPIVHGALSAARFVIWKIIRGVLRICWAAETGDSGRAHIFSQNLLGVARK